MNGDGRKGGRGECPFCHEWHNNVSYHSAWDCKMNPVGMAGSSYSTKQLEQMKPKLHCPLCAGSGEFNVDGKIVKCTCREEKSAFAGAGAHFWPADNEGNPQQPKPDHECQYDADGDGCRICGKTVAESLIEVQQAVYDGGNPKPTTRPAGLDFKCNSCGRQLTVPGAILFSPPKETAGGETIMCNKYHLCEECFELICDVTNLKY